MTSASFSFGGSDKKGTKDDDDECVVVRTEHANADEVAQARKLLLPDDFYLYRLRKPCPGCPGCENDNDNDNALQKPQQQQQTHESSPFNPGHLFSSSNQKQQQQQQGAATRKSFIPTFTK